MEENASFSRAEALAIKLLSYLVATASVIGTVISVYRQEPIVSVLFLLILFAVVVIKSIYSRRLCIKCKITSCPFNPKQ